ncbi:uncharacterized protein PV09_05931 [Verruconis gallopava]|uniref:Uncharacterized protein n=1 Tax=Verruconis gallopava TaxID=253628 RepID=A0A0D1XKM2_9PEZI|nr:uncharacterized protein PV09_05931 [Verruconis gallopava]KIW02881.1 hypothetical protein PV09_05931 [Verruconis gallopava]
MMRPSSILVSLALLTSATLADDGQYHPDQYGAGTTTGTATATLRTYTAQAYGTATTSPTTVVASQLDKTSGAGSQVTATASENDATATAGWESQVTWPAGCEEWANPCPSGAHISGGSIAGYTNGFTSFLTETNSNGVITGMPSKATIPAGVQTTSISATTLLTATSTSNSTSAPSSASSTQSGFTTGTSSAQQSNGAGINTVSAFSMLLVVAAVASLY